MTCGIPDFGECVAARKGVADEGVPAVVDGEMALRQRIDYDAFGQITSVEDGAGSPQSLSDLETDTLWQGLLWDDDSGLYNNRARWYDAETGRFISEDPVADDRQNLYRRTANDPVNATDPSGLFQAGNPVDALFGGFSGGTYLNERPIDLSLSSAGLPPLYIDTFNSRPISNSISSLGGNFGLASPQSVGHTYSSNVRDLQNGIFEILSQPTTAEMVGGAGGNIDTMQLLAPPPGRQVVSVTEYHSTRYGDYFRSPTNALAGPNAVATGYVLGAVFDTLLPPSTGPTVVTKYDNGDEHLQLPPGPSTFDQLNLALTLSPFVLAKSPAGFSPQLVRSGTKSGAANVVDDGVALVDDIVSGGRQLKLPEVNPHLAGTNRLGETLPNGEVFLRPGLSRPQQAATLRHESVHSFLSVGDDAPLATLRQNVGVGAYDNSVFFNATEEMLAEGIASRSVRQGIRHAFNGAYVVRRGTAFETLVTPRAFAFELGVGATGIGATGYGAYQIGGHYFGDDDQ